MLELDSSETGLLTIVLKLYEFPVLSVLLDTLLDILDIVTGGDTALTPGANMELTTSLGITSSPGVSMANTESVFPTPGTIPPLENLNRPLNPATSVRSREVFLADRLLNEPRAFNLSNKDTAVSTEMPSSLAKVFNPYGEPGP